MKTLSTYDAQEGENKPKGQGNKSNSRHYFSLFFNETSNLKRGEKNLQQEYLLKTNNKYDIKWRIVQRSPTKIKKNTRTPVIQDYVLQST